MPVSRKASSAVCRSETRLGQASLPKPDKAGILTAWRSEISAMIMFLPFLTAAIAVWFGLRGSRAGTIAMWVVTFVIYLAWLKYHITDQLAISL